MPEEQNIVIPFSPKAEQVVFNIVEKYELKESREETFEKLKKNKLFNSNIIVKLTRDFVKGIISEEELIGLLKKELGIIQQMAEKISKDIIKDLIPLLEKYSEEELTKLRKEKGEKNIEKPIVTTPIKPPIGLEKTLKKEILEPISEKPPVVKRSPLTKITEKTVPEKSKDTKTTKKEDIYKEPID